jgi:dTDP-4-dehydrorhamnose reductase
MIRVLILGATGMLGHTLFREFGQEPGIEVWGAARASSARPALSPPPGAAGMITDFTADAAGFERALDVSAAHAVINCVGLIKQHSRAADPVEMITTNSVFPHIAARECAAREIRFIHISTDCVFSGADGGYGEDSTPDARDLYGRSKLLGEVGAPALTLRTSLIGHEPYSAISLIDWFLAQTGTVQGFHNAIYSGLTTSAFAAMLATAVLPRRDLVGLFQVASAPISKYDLLAKVASVYGWDGELVAFDDFHCDRSLRADAFRLATGYTAPTWDDMIVDMYRNRG